ncbi:MAG TPA: endonuclease/exonuclease/phosphatase family protein [Planctomycetota bacterium]|nr:endonuclease/exonuclease/phosphatase family protein [Planctomycetota bacterium]
MEMKLITWNVLNGREEAGKDWSNWAGRKKVFKTILEREKPDVFCAQEALVGQLKHFDEVLKDHQRVGVGRSDGKEDGEFCAIYFDAKRFKKLDDGTFWLSDTPENPGGKRFDPQYERICTWVKLQDVKTEKVFFVFNNHFPLTADGREKAAALVVEKAAAIAEKSPAILCGDFNCGPDSKPWKIFEDAKWAHTAIEAKRKRDQITFHKFGLRLAVLDAVFTKSFSCSEDRVMEDSEDKVLPSDHYGIAVRLRLKTE